MSQQQSWKKYGGIHSFETLSNIITTNIVADHLSLKYPYQGIFTICGELIVSGETYLDNDVFVYGNAFHDKNVFIHKSLNVNETTDLSGDLFAHGNTFQYNPLYFVGTNGQGLNNGIGNMYFLGDTTGVGMNKTNPQAILDIYGTRPEILNVFSNQTSTKNILARNRWNYGITLTSDVYSSAVNFYHKDIPINSIYDNGNGAGQIQYEPTGTMTISNPIDLKILSKMIISDRTDQLSDQIDGETVTIYDTSGGVYLQDVYNNKNAYTGNALSLISTDANSTTFLNIYTEEQMGWKWGAGVLPTDPTRHMGTMGYMDDNNRYVPSETIVSGNSLVNNRSTIGINTYSPKTENYVMDINGPISIQHEELHLIQNVNFEVVSMSFSKNYINYGIAIGKSNTIDNKNNYSYYFLNTTNGGHSWKVSPLVYNNTIGNVIFKVFYYDPYNIIISSNNGYLFYSNNAGNTWKFIQNLFQSSTEPSIYITPIGYINDTQIIRTYLAYPFDSYNNVPASIYSFDNYVMPNITSPIITTKYDINCMHGYMNYLFVAGNGNIDVFDIYSNKIIHNNTHQTNYIYTAIFTLDGENTIAVGNDIISYTKNYGQTWTDIPLTTNFNSVYIWNTTYAIAVGDFGSIYYTKDGYDTWNELNINQINGMGNGANIINNNVNITNVIMTAIDTFILSCVTQSYNPDNKQTGNTNMFYLYLPDLFDRTNHSSILDICGNMVISGDIHVNDDGNIQTNNDVFYLLNQNANTIYFVGDASNVHIGSSISGGTTFINHQLDVSQNTHLHQNVLVNGIETIDNIMNTIDLSSGALQVYGGISVKKNVFIGGNNVIYGDISLNGNERIQGNLNVYGNTTLGDSPNQDVLNVNSKSYFNNDVSMSNYLFVMGDVSLNSNIFVANNGDVSNNLSIGNDLYVVNDASIDNDLIVVNNTIVGNDLYVMNDVSIDNNLIVYNDSYFNNDVFVYNNEWISGNLNISKDISLNQNQYIGNNLFVAKDISLNGNLHANGNTVIGTNNGNTFTINASTNFISDVSFSKTAYINHLYVNGNQEISGNLLASGSLVQIGENSDSVMDVYSTSNFWGDVSMNNLYVNDIYTDSIINSSNLFIGLGSDIIQIGSADTTIRMSSRITGSFSSSGTTLILNQGDNERDDARNAGLYISENETVYGSFFATSYDRNQVKFKAPASKDVVSIGISDLSLNLGNNKNGILVLKKFPDSTNNKPEEAITHQINVSTFDISHILQRSLTESTTTKQVILTDLSIKGKVVINSSTISPNNNASLDLSGNFVHSNGWITQF
jgi:acyl-[acyl carrier protein]--UDP-N-acetylglucosamine O-acyltransferase